MNMNINTLVSYLKVQSNAGQGICTDYRETRTIRKIYNSFLSTFFRPELLARQWNTPWED